MWATAATLPQTIEGQVMQDLEEPYANVAVFPALVPTSDRPLETVLYKVVRSRTVTHEPTSVTAQSRNERFDQGNNFVH
jgi:hypothetical protein